MLPLFEFPLGAFDQSLPKPLQPGVDRGNCQLFVSCIVHQRGRSPVAVGEKMTLARRQLGQAVTQDFPSKFKQLAAGGPHPNNLGKCLVIESDASSPISLSGISPGHIERNSAGPFVEIRTRIKFVIPGPQNDTDLLDHVIRIVAIADNRHGRGIKFPVTDGQEP